MLLRTRIGVIVALAFVLACTGLVLASFEREKLINTRYSNAMVSDQAVLWLKINEQLIQRMEDRSDLATANGDLLQALESGNHAIIQFVGAEIAETLQGDGTGTRFDVVYPDGALAFSSHPELFQTPILTTEATRDAVGNDKPVRGLGIDGNRNIAAVFGVPLRSSGQIVGMGIFASDIQEAIDEMEHVTSSLALLVNRRGRVLVGRVDAGWDRLEDLVDLGEQASPYQTADIGDEVFSVLVLPQENSIGAPMGSLVIVKDITDVTVLQRQVSEYAIFGIAAFIVLVLLGLSIYLSRSFTPLSEGVRVLNALTRGDLRVQIEHAGGKDEVGRIANSVNIIRAHLVAFDRLRRSRQRQRIRQERFIRREMTQLADMLDEEEKLEILSELEQLEQRLISDTEETTLPSIIDGPTDASADVGATTLSMMALAFQNMSTRVQDQNFQLREALKAKNAFIALQRELDIAARVQLSLCPREKLPSDSFEYAGAMKPAKEVGGDFFDFFRLDPHRVGVVIADVSGKGVPASLFMVMTRTLIRSMAVQIESPGQLLETINDFLERNNDEQLFVTVFYGVVDERTGRLVYANGGHNPPIVANKTNVRPLEMTGGVALGMFGSLQYSESDIELSPGTRLVLTTDGVTEAFNDKSQEFGEKRLMEAVQALPDQEPEDDVSSIITAVENFAGDEPQFDDITCVVLCCKENSATDLLPADSL